MVLVIVSFFNSLSLVPVLLSVFGSSYETLEQPPEKRDIDESTFKGTNKPSQRNHQEKQSCCRGHKTRCYLRVQSEISLSTISEEPQSEVHTPASDTGTNRSRSNKLMLWI